MRIIGSLMAAALLMATQGCASGPEARPKVAYRVSAKENFLKGKKAYADEDYLEAIEYFRFVKNKFPYSAYATEADLLLADCHFARERYIEAADAYADFIKLHPKNEKVPYASFRIGVCYYKRIPSDFFIFPPGYELDQKESARAVRELERYLNEFPDDEHAAEGREMLADAKRRMAERVRFVMRFNRSREKFRGVLWRAEQLLKDYPGPFDEEALLAKAEAQIELGEAEAARSTLGELLERFPKGDSAGEARDLMKRLLAAPKQEESAK